VALCVNGGSVKIVNVLLIALVALLSIAAGVAKVLEVPQELEFLKGFGFSLELIIFYGLFQILGGALLAIPKTLKLGAIITTLSFTLSTVLIFIGGNLTFGLASLLPIIFTNIIYWQSVKVKL
jgi:hypothetical protein